MKKIVNTLFGRLTVIGLTILLQFAWIFVMFWRFSYQYTYVSIVFRMLAIILVFVIVNRWINPAHKLSWTFLILLSPVLGVLLYAFFGRSGLTRHVAKGMDQVHQEIGALLEENDDVNGRLQRADISAYHQSRYINDWAGYPLYQNTATNYYPCGEMLFPDLMEALKSAEKFIFLEYFIIDNGYMFGTVEKILEQKAKEGVEVRLIYDDVGCIGTLPSGFSAELEKKGIQCAVFNPFLPVLSVIMNNRDHRKILVVDGNIGFTGGINLADEYINKIERFGYWKDTAIRIEGEAVWSLTTMFLEMWNCIKKSEEDYRRYMPDLFMQFPAEGGFVQPYGDTPLDHENVGENIYLNIINRAKEYVYIFTPYLIIDNEMIVALCNAAKSGIDVRIVTPGIPDKKMVWLLSQSYYRPLIEAGVRIFQYTPGFIHAKCFVCDDEVATVGTVNLDFRSLYLHFECGIWMYGARAVMQVKEDCIDTFQKSKEISLAFCMNRPLPVRILQSLMRLLAPLL